MRPPSPSIPEKDFFFAALDQNARLDGREFLQARPHDLSFGPELGNVECSLGKTRLRTAALSESLPSCKKTATDVTTPPFIAYAYL
jgi:exosome complex RNA-binding protein Rrp42 (RNase PH superfamily)